jgi:hypothetical protein
MTSDVYQPYSVKYPLHAAVRDADIEKIRSFLITGSNIDINLIDNSCKTPIHYALHHNIVISRSVTFDILKILIEYGADVNNTNYYWSHLQYALYYNLGMDILRFLLENGANVNQCDYFGHSVLHYAVICNNIDIIKYLIEKGAKVYQSSKGNESLIKYCITHFNTKCIPILLAAGADQTGLDITYDYDFIRIKYIHDSTIYLTLAIKEIELIGFNSIRERAGTICIAMQDLNLPAPQMIEIIVQACVPFAENLPYHYLWDLVVTVKHFHDRQSKKMLVKPM